MEGNKIIQQIIILLCFGHYVFSLTIKTDDIVIFQEDNSINLNCTYQKGSNEDISKRDIKWQKLIGDKFENLAIFSPPGSQQPFIQKEMQPFYNNRTELIAPNTSLSAVMNIKDPICSDEGIYRCQIGYYSDSSEKNQTSRSVVEFKAEAVEPEEFFVFPNELEENQSISLTCRADVGSPRGYIQISRVSQNSGKSELIYKFDSISNKTEKCTGFINVTTTYTVTKEDNGAIFRCSSQNNLTQGHEPSKESSKITVIYGPDIPGVTLKPSKSEYFVGDSLTIECSTDSNPPPVFTWRFLSENKSEEQIERLFNKSKLVFESLKPTNIGNYTCTATNTARPKHPNTTSLPVFVKISKRMYPGCDHCGHTKIWQHKNRRNEGFFNVWIPIAVVFIITSATFAVTSIILIIQRRKAQESTETNNMLNIQRNSSLLPHNTEPDGYTTTEDVVKYAVVQNKSTKDNQVSNNNVYDRAWN